MPRYRPVLFSLALLLISVSVTLPFLTFRLPPLHLPALARRDLRRFFRSPFISHQQQQQQQPFDSRSPERVELEKPFEARQTEPVRTEPPLHKAVDLVSDSGPGNGRLTVSSDPGGDRGDLYGNAQLLGEPGSTPSRASASEAHSYNERSTNGSAEGPEAARGVSSTDASSAVSGAPELPAEPKSDDSEAASSGSVAGAEGECESALMACQQQQELMKLAGGGGEGGEGGEGGVGDMVQELAAGMKSLDASFRLALWKEEHCQANQSALRWTNQMLRHDVTHLKAQLAACDKSGCLHLKKHLRKHLEQQSGVIVNNSEALDRRGVMGSSEEEEGGSSHTGRGTRHDERRDKSRSAGERGGEDGRQSKGLEGEERADGVSEDAYGGRRGGSKDAGWGGGEDEEGSGGEDDEGRSGGMGESARALMVLWEAAPSLGLRDVRSAAVQHALTQLRRAVVAQGGEPVGEVGTAQGEEGEGKEMNVGVQQAKRQPDALGGAGESVGGAGEEAWLSEEEEQRLVPAAPHVDHCASLATDISLLDSRSADGELPDWSLWGGRLGLVARRLEEREREKVRREREREGEGRAGKETEEVGGGERMGEVKGEEEEEGRKAEGAAVVAEAEGQLEEEEQARAVQHEAMRLQAQERMQERQGAREEQAEVAAWMATARDEQLMGDHRGAVLGPYPPWVSAVARAMCSTPVTAAARFLSICYACRTPSTPLPTILQVSGADEDNLPMTRRAQRDLWVHQHPRDCSHPSVKFLVVDVLRKVRGSFLGVGAQVNWLAGVLGTAVVEGRVLVVRHYHRAAHDGCHGGLRCSNQGREEIVREACRQVCIEAAGHATLSLRPPLSAAATPCSCCTHPGPPSPPPAMPLPPITLAMLLPVGMAATYLMRYPSPCLCRLLNRARHRAFSPALAARAARFLPSNWPKTVEQLPDLTSRNALGSEGKIEEIWQAASGGAIGGTGALSGTGAYRAAGGYVPEGLVAVHVRQGDKAGEMAMAGVDVYLALLGRVRRQFPHADSVWLSTEMQAVVDAAKHYTQWRFHTTDFPRQALPPPPPPLPRAFLLRPTQAVVDATRHYTRWRFHATDFPRQAAGESMDAYDARVGEQRATDNAYVNLLISADAPFFVGTMGSTWSVLIDNLRVAGRGKARVGMLSVNRDRYWFGETWEVWRDLYRNITV
ncbi:unnamed protein product [Closterium sp. NIES-65]|nr:unnamed protein product [Closterium sp. NIES-65]CAI6010144.1 unnamed protein product [Closterium sp. NIES-65]